MAINSVLQTRLKVLAVATVWTLYLVRGNRHGPGCARRASRRLTKRLTSYQSGGFALLFAYLLRHGSELLGFREPTIKMDRYDPAYARTVRILTAFDAGYWTAMGIERKWLRDICEMAFSIQYLFRPSRAAEIVRTTRQNLTIDHLRVAWDKPHSTYLSMFSQIRRPVYMHHEPRKLMMARPKGSTYKHPVTAWLYFEGTDSELKQQTKVVLDIPGGGFVSMDPRCNDDRLMPWAAQLGYPVLSLDYGKAPEFPYPYALNEAYDVYCSLTETKGSCIGLSGDIVPRIVISGDSAGGNIATGTTFKILDTKTEKGLMMPEGLMLVYPAFNFDTGFWMDEEQVELMKESGVAERMLRERSAAYKSYLNNHLVSPHNMIGSAVPGKSILMTAVAAYADDLILTPEMMWAMLTMYIGPSKPVNFKTDYYLQPAVAPEEKLAQLPKMFILTGDRDPLVDDSVNFTGKVRRAKKRLSSKEVDPVHLELIPGYSHGYMQFLSLLPEAKQYVTKTAGWVEDLFSAAQAKKQ